MNILPVAAENESNGKETSQSSNTDDDANESAGEDQANHQFEDSEENDAGKFRQYQLGYAWVNT